MCSNSSQKKESNYDFDPDKVFTFWEFQIELLHLLPFLNNILTSEGEVQTQ
jgi:hypothetical protein